MIRQAIRDLARYIIKVGEDDPKAKHHGTDSHENTDDGNDSSVDSSASDDGSVDSNTSNDSSDESSTFDDNSVDSNTSNDSSVDISTSSSISVQSSSADENVIVGEKAMLMGGDYVGYTGVAMNVLHEKVQVWVVGSNIGTVNINRENVRLETDE